MCKRTLPRPLAPSTIPCITSCAREPFLALLHPPQYLASHHVQANPSSPSCTLHNTLHHIMCKRTLPRPLAPSTIPCITSCAREPFLALLHPPQYLASHHVQANPSSPSCTLHNTLHHIMCKRTLPRPLAPSTIPCITSCAREPSPLIVRTNH